MLFTLGDIAFDETTTSFLILLETLNHIDRYVLIFRHSLVVYKLDNHLMINIMNFYMCFSYGTKNGSPSRYALSSLASWRVLKSVKQNTPPGLSALLT